jgi:hypothetical protein
MARSRLYVAAVAIAATVMAAFVAAAPASASALPKADLAVSAQGSVTAPVGNVPLVPLVFHNYGPGTVAAGTFDFERAAGGQRRVAAPGEIRDRPLAPILNLGQVRLAVVDDPDQARLGQPLAQPQRPQPLAEGSRG